MSIRTLVQGRSASCFLFTGVMSIGHKFISYAFRDVDAETNVVTQSVLMYAAVGDTFSAAGGIMALLYFFSKLAHKRKGAAIDDESARVVATGFSIAAFVGYAICVG